MKIFLLLAIGLFIFSCERANRDNKSNTTSETENSQQVNKGAGTEISPQLEGVKDSATRLQVDTINSAQEAEHR